MQVYVPTTSIFFRYEGSDVMWVENRTTIEEGHPILKGREHLVKPIDIDFAVSQTETQRVAIAPASDASDAGAAPEPDPAAPPKKRRA